MNFDKNIIRQNILDTINCTSAYYKQEKSNITISEVREKMKDTKFL